LSSNQKGTTDTNGSGGSKKRDLEKNREHRKESRKEEAIKDDLPEKKESKVERAKRKEKDRMRLEKIESEISKKCGLKSERFVDIDMFAPKARPPKLAPATISTPK